MFVASLINSFLRVLPKPVRHKALSPALAAVLLLPACASQPAPEAAKPPEPVAQEQVAMARDEAPSAFQAVLNSHGVPFDIPRHGKAILVNIPSYELIAFEDGEPVMRSRVIVGKPVTGDRTPLIDTYTSVVRFRPTWRPTPMMVRSGKYEDRLWPPGPRNPLGLLAIRLEPGMLIYLHGTNRPALFERESRALSAGCVRVERWDEVAAWVLGVGVEEVHRNARGGRTFDMDTSGVPVFLRYYTRFPDDDGTLRHFEDVYRLGPTVLSDA